jgi:hypothetical protein
MLLCSHSFPRFAQHTECVLVDFNVCVCVCVCVRACVCMCAQNWGERGRGRGLQDAFLFLILFPLSSCNLRLSFSVEGRQNR